MGYRKVLVKTPDNVFLGLEDLVVVDPEHFLVEGILGDAVMVVEPGLGTPADVEGREDVRRTPIEDFLELLPVVHRFERKIFHRGSGNDQTIELFVLDLVEGGVKSLQVVRGCIPGFVGSHVQE